MKQKFWRVAGLILILTFLIGLVGFILWASNPAEPEPKALAIINNRRVLQDVPDQDWLVFKPENQASNTGLILYPGARVDYRAYAPHAEGIAQAGFTVVVVPMPLNLAFFGVNKAANVIEAIPEVTNWAIGGHSLGGAMASQFTLSNPEFVSGLVLWAAYPGQNANLKDVGVEVLSIYASEDGLASLEEIKNSKARLPEDTTYINIKGGNHAGFGWYGPQNGDGVAEISQEEQQGQIVSATVAFLQDIQE
jgi:dienelactone hydrolase